MGEVPLYVDTGAGGTHRSRSPLAFSYERGTPVEQDFILTSGAHPICGKHASTPPPAHRCLSCKPSDNGTNGALVCPNTILCPPRRSLPHAWP